jgi:predicted nucleic acid-binding protein
MGIESPLPAKIDKFIECAVALKAQFVISGDKALVEVKNYMGIKIVTPKEFLDLQP